MEGIEPSSETWQAPIITFILQTHIWYPYSDSNREFMIGNHMCCQLALQGHYSLLIVHIPQSKDFSLFDS